MRSGGASAVPCGTPGLAARRGIATPKAALDLIEQRLKRAKEDYTKAQLASHIRQIIERRRLTQAAAAKLMGIEQPKVSALLKGRPNKASEGRELPSPSRLFRVDAS